jgi:hypothetical protein
MGNHGHLGTYAAGAAGFGLGNARGVHGQSENATGVHGKSVTVIFKLEIPPIFVDRGNAGGETGSQAEPFNTVLEAINSIPVSPRTLRISGGTYPENLVISTPCTLKGWRNGSAVIGR